MKHQNIFICIASFICILLIVTARHHPPSRRKIKEIWHGRVYWEGESNTTMLRSSSEKVLITNLDSELDEDATVVKQPEVVQPPNPTQKAITPTKSLLSDVDVKIKSDILEQISNTDVQSPVQALNTKPMIAICAATHSKSNWRSLDATSLQKLLISSIIRTISTSDRSKYDFRLYLAADHDDQFWLQNQNNIKTPDWLSVHIGFYDVPKHKIPFNPMMRAAYNDGAEYLVRINDDSEFVTSDWVSKAVAKLASYDPPNVGMVGPNCHEGNTAIMTHDMVHRTHLDIFEHYYPDVFSAWWIDDWISKVYGPQRSTKMMDWTVKHHTHKHGTRYEVQHHEAKLLKGELEKGGVRVVKWVEETYRITKEQCSEYTLSKYIWDADIQSVESSIQFKQAPDNSDWFMDGNLLDALSKNHSIAYKEIVSSYQQANFNQKITGLGKDFSHKRVATIKNALCDTSGLIVNSATCHVFRNGGCDINQNSKFSIKDNAPKYDKVITIAMSWGSETWHFVGEALVGLAYVQNIETYKIHVTAKTKFVVEWLRIVGVQEHQIVTGTIFAKTLLIPELGKCGNPAPQQIRWLQEKINSYLPDNQQDKHVLIVKRTKSRTQANWSDILQVVKRFSPNVVIHDDSDLPSVQQQLENFRNAHTVIAPHGAGLLNILAARPNTKVIEFMDTNDINLYYARLAYIAGLNYNAIVMKSSMGYISEVLQKNTQQIPNNFQIHILTMNRAKSLQRLLDSLENTDYGGDRVEVYIHIDKYKDNQACIQVAQAFELTRGDVTFDIADTNQGLRNSWFSAWSSQGNEHAIIIEDDIELSPQWYSWLQKAWKTYGDRDDLAGISLQRQTLVPQKPHKQMEIINNHEPFLYKLVGSIGFSPHWKQWRAFLNWIDSVDTATVNVKTPGLITSDWLDNLDRRHMWTQYFIWFCNQHDLYTLYINLPNKKTLAAHMREKGEHFARTEGRDFALASKISMSFPTDLVKYGWDGQVVKDIREVASKLDCWDTYQKNIDTGLSQKFVPGKSVMMGAASVKMLCDLLNADTRVLEWGSGGSTLFFSQFVKSWDTVEHNVDWIPKMKEYTKELSNVHFHTAKHSWDGLSNNGDGSYKDFEEYVNLPQDFTSGPYDVVIVDGRARVDCALSTLRNHLLSPNGVVLIHDWERSMYKEVLDAFETVQTDIISSRHMVVLKPKKEKIVQAVAPKLVKDGTEYGGWTYDSAPITATSIVYSVGLGEDTSWDEGIVKRFGLQVWGFDPTPKSIEYVNSNVNLGQNFHFTPEGLGIKKDVLTFTKPQNPSHVSMREGKHDGLGETVEVPVNSLKNWMQTFGHTHLDILKIDIEGSEYDVLEDWIQKKWFPMEQLLVEFHQRFFADKTRHNNVLNGLKANGFQIIYNKGGNGQEISFRKKKNNAILVPKLTVASNVGAPVVYVHWGNIPAYLIATVTATAKYNNVVILSDSLSQKNRFSSLKNVELLALDCSDCDVLKEKFVKFHSTIVVSPNYPINSEIRNEIRYRALRNYMKAHSHTKQIVYCDSDVAVLVPTNTFDFFGSSCDATISFGPTESKYATHGGTKMHSFWAGTSVLTLKVLDSYAEYIDWALSDTTLGKVLSTKTSSTNDMTMWYLFTAGVVGAVQAEPNLKDVSFPKNTRDVKICAFNVVDAQRAEAAPCVVDWGLAWKSERDNLNWNNDALEYFRHKDWDSKLEKFRYPPPRKFRMCSIHFGGGMKSEATNLLFKTAVPKVSDAHHEHEGTRPSSKIRAPHSPIPIVLTGINYQMNQVSRATIPFMCSNNNRVIILSNVNQNPISGADCLEVEDISGLYSKVSSEMTWPKRAPMNQKIYFERWYVLRDWMRRSGTTRVFVMDSDAFMIQNITKLVHDHWDIFSDHEMWFAYNPPRSSWPFALLSLAALEDITHFWNKALAPDVWTSEFIKGTEPNDMVLLGHYSHSAVGKPYPCWGYGPEHGDGSCDNSIAYGHTKVLERLAAKNIRAKFAPGTLTLDRNGKSALDVGVVDNNYRHDPMHRYEMKNGQKQLQFLEGVPQFKLITGKWVPMWGYILEDAMEGCVNVHLKLVKSKATCMCSDFCCKSCTPPPLPLPSLTVWSLWKGNFDVFLRMHVKFYFDFWKADRLFLNIGSDVLVKSSPTVHDVIVSLCGDKKKRIEVKHLSNALLDRYLCKSGKTIDVLYYKSKYRKFQDSPQVWGNQKEVLMGLYDKSFDLTERKMYVDHDEFFVPIDKNINSIRRSTGFNYHMIDIKPVQGKRDWNNTLQWVDQPYFYRLRYIGGTYPSDGWDGNEPLTTLHRKSHNGPHKEHDNLRKCAKQGSDAYAHCVSKYNIMYHISVHDEDYFLNQKHFDQTTGHGKKIAITEFPKEYLNPEKDYVVFNNEFLRQFVPKIRHEKAPSFSPHIKISKFVQQGKIMQKKNGFVNIQLLNHGYVEMTKSWICNVRSFPGVLDKIMFITTDQNAYDQLVKFDSELNVVLELYETPKDLTYGQYAYYDFMLFRTKLLLQLLKNDIVIWLTESDAVWLKDPSDVVLNTKGDMVTMSDGAPPQKILQGGFQLLRPTKPTVSVWTKLLTTFQNKMSASKKGTEMNDSGSEQLMLNSLIRKEPNLNVQWLDWHLFAPGLYYRDKNKFPQPMIILNNWIKGNPAKIARAKKWNHWYLDGNGECSWTSVRLVF